MSKTSETLDMSKATPLDILQARKAVTSDEKVAAFEADICGLFAAFPMIQLLSIVTYTPWGFNDGDPSYPRTYVAVNSHPWDGYGYIFLETGEVLDYEGVYDDDPEDEDVAEAIKALETYPRPDKEPFAMAAFVGGQAEALFGDTALLYKRLDDGTVVRVDKRGFDAEH